MALMMRGVPMMGDWVTVRLNEAETGGKNCLVRTRMVIMAILIWMAWKGRVGLYRNRAYGMYKVCRFRDVTMRADGLKRGSSYWIIGCIIRSNNREMLGEYNVYNGLGDKDIMARSIVMTLVLISECGTDEQL